VNNSAAGENIAGGRFASARSRSLEGNRKTVNCRLPGEPEALAATSNRTTPQEGCNISSVDGRAKQQQKFKPQHVAMNNPEQQPGSWLEQRGFGGLDWASQKHNVVVVDPQGKVIEDFEIEHSALGWKKFRERMQPYGSIPFAIETSQGAAVEQLLEAGMEVYPLNPKSAQSYRERKAPSGVKGDRLDAWSFADACRVDGHGWKALRPEDALVKELRLLCRDEVVLIEQRTAFINQLQHAGPKIAPRLLSEIGDDRDRFGEQPQALQCLAGTAPVTRQSGKPRCKPPCWPVHQRWACDKHLRHAIYLFAEQTLTRCFWAELYYRHHRQKGRSHADSLRRLGQRWLKIIFRMWMDRVPYDAMLHHQNQIKHGSWVLQFNPTQPN